MMMGSWCERDLRQRCAPDALALQLYSKNVSCQLILITIDHNLIEMGSWCVGGPSPNNHQPPISHQWITNQPPITDQSPSTSKQPITNHQSITTHVLISKQSQSLYHWMTAGVYRWSATETRAWRTRGASTARCRLGPPPSGEGARARVAECCGLAS
jgi:hypothetical protein